MTIRSGRLETWFAKDIDAVVELIDTVNAKIRIRRIKIIEVKNLFISFPRFDSLEKVCLRMGKFYSTFSPC